MGTITGRLRSVIASPRWRLIALISMMLFVGTSASADQPKVVEVTACGYYAARGLYHCEDAGFLPEALKGRVTLAQLEGRRCYTQVQSSYGEGIWRRYTQVQAGNGCFFFYGNKSWWLCDKGGEYLYESPSVLSERKPPANRWMKRADYDDLPKLTYHQAKSVVE